MVVLWGGGGVLMSEIPVKGLVASDSSESDRLNSVSRQTS